MLHGQGGNARLWMQEMQTHVLVLLFSAVWPKGIYFNVMNLDVLTTDNKTSV
jgi:hypothetical protein